jgi:dsRNA-specific ribonuclease
MEADTSMETTSETIIPQQDIPVASEESTKPEPQTEPIAQESKQEQGTEESNEQDGDEPPNKKLKLVNGTEAPAQGQGQKSKKNKNKRARETEPLRPLPPKDPLNHLKKGLLYILDSVDTEKFAQDIRQHAQELQRLLFLRPTGTDADVTTVEQATAPASPPPSSDQAQPESDKKAVQEPLNPHTELPPPFALPDPKGFMKGPSPALAKLNAIAPSTSSFAALPVMANFATTTSLPEPESTALPALPQITDIGLFNAPFTHTSALAAYIPPTNTNSYEPLEFLGDAYLEVIATRLIHARFPLHTVGQKAGLREIIVKNDTLAEYSRAYGFATRVRTSDSVKQQAGPAWTKVLADVFEAYVACIIIQDPTEKGFLTAEQWLTDLWAPKILEWKAKGDGVKHAPHTGPAQLDAKSDLNRLIVGKESKVEYREERPMEMIMPGNRQNFFIGVYLNGLGFTDQHLGSGEGRSKQIAGMAAAADALANSQDIIAMANRRKMDAERMGKKKAGDGARRGGHRGGMRGGFNNHPTNTHAVNPHRGYSG